jgi:hypothetical protein
MHDCRWLLAIVVSFSCLAGCASLFKSTKEIVPITTEPAGANVTWAEPGGAMCVKNCEVLCKTPCEVKADRGRTGSRRLWVSLDGYERDFDYVEVGLSNWIWANFGFGIWGLALFAGDFYLDNPNVVKTERLDFVLDKNKVKENVVEEDVVAEEKPDSALEDLQAKVQSPRFGQLRARFPVDYVQQQLAHYQAGTVKARLWMLTLAAYEELLRAEANGDSQDIDAAIRVALLQNPAKSRESSAF